MLFSATGLEENYQILIVWKKNHAPGIYLWLGVWVQVSARITRTLSAGSMDAMDAKLCFMTAPQD